MIPINIPICINYFKIKPVLFYFRIQPIPVGHTSAILRYTSHTGATYPQTHPRYCSQEDSCKVLNCAAQTIRHAHTQCVHVTDLRYNGNKVDLIGVSGGKI